MSGQYCRLAPLTDILRILEKFDYSDSLQLKWELIYLLKVPVFKFVLHEASSVALAAMITMLPSTLELERHISDDPYFIGCCKLVVRLELRTAPSRAQSQKLLTFAFYDGQTSGSLPLAFLRCKRFSPLVSYVRLSQMDHKVLPRFTSRRGGGKRLHSGPKTASISWSC